MKPKKPKRPRIKRKVQAGVDPVKPSYELVKIGFAADRVHIHDVDHAE